MSASLPLNPANPLAEAMARRLAAEEGLFSAAASFADSLQVPRPARAWTQTRIRQPRFEFAG